LNIGNFPPRRVFMNIHYNRGTFDPFTLSQLLNDNFAIIFELELTYELMRSYSIVISTALMSVIFKEIHIRRGSLYEYHLENSERFPIYVETLSKDRKVFGLKDRRYCENTQ
jgi:hypothetical protein